MPRSRKKNASRALPEPPALIAPDRVLLSALAVLTPLLRLVSLERDGSTPMHDRAVVELVHPRFRLGFRTGWQAQVELVSGDCGEGAAPRDKLEVVDWGIDNHGPMGMLGAFNDLTVREEGHVFVTRPPLDRKAVLAARTFARALARASGARSFEALVRAAFAFAHAGEPAADWRARNLAACATAGAAFLPWGS